MVLLESCRDLWDEQFQKHLPQLQLLFKDRYRHNLIFSMCTVARHSCIASALLFMLVIEFMMYEGKRRKSLWDHVLRWKKAGRPNFKDNIVL